MENPIRKRVKEIDISELTREIGQTFGYAIGTFDILRGYLEKTHPRMVIELSETGFYVLIGADRGDIISEFEKFYPYVNLEWTAEIVAEKFGIEKTLIIYGEWDTLVVFY
jgi:hypothetical protein